MKSSAVLLGLVEKAEKEGGRKNQRAGWSLHAKRAVGRKGARRGEVEEAELCAVDVCGGLELRPRAQRAVEVDKEALISRDGVTAAVGRPWRQTWPALR